MDSYSQKGLGLTFDAKNENTKKQKYENSYGTVGIMSSIRDRYF